MVAEKISLEMARGSAILVGVSDIFFYLISRIDERITSRIKVMVVVMYDVYVCVGGR